MIIDMGSMVEVISEQEDGLSVSTQSFAPPEAYDWISKQPLYKYMSPAVTSHAMTTSRISHIPREYTLEMLLHEWLNRGSHDILQMPYSLKLHLNLGHAVANFTPEFDAQRFRNYGLSNLRSFHDSRLFVTDRNRFVIVLKPLFHSTNFSPGPVSGFHEAGGGSSSLPQVFVLHFQLFLDNMKLLPFLRLLPLSERVFSGQAAPCLPLPSSSTSTTPSQFSTAPPPPPPPKS